MPTPANCNQGTPLGVAICAGVVLSYLLSYHVWTRLWCATDCAGPSQQIEWHARIHCFGESFYAPLRVIAQRTTAVHYFVYDVLTYRPTMSGSKTTSSGTRDSDL